MVVRIGFFYIICVFFVVIGKWFGDVGFVDVLMESGIVGLGFVGGVIEGCYYNWVVCIYKVFMNW